MVVLAAALLAGWAVKKIVDLLLRDPLISQAAVAWLLTQSLFRSVAGPDWPGSPASRTPFNRVSLLPPVYNTDLLNNRRRASYLIAAARRISEATRSGDLAQVDAAWQREMVYLQQHADATQKRQRAATATAVTMLNERNKPGLVNRDRFASGKSLLLGWYAIQDARTTPDCLRANGCNFDPSIMPAIGYPGAVHLQCRCRSGPPRRDASLLPAIGGQLLDGVVAASSTHQVPVELSDKRINRVPWS